jgi:hypothetical protein
MEEVEPVLDLSGGISIQVLSFQAAKIMVRAKSRLLGDNDN